MPDPTSRPLIGVTTYARHAEHGFWIPAEYVDAVRRAGGQPHLIAPGDPWLDETLARLDGVILSGGGDLDPKHYGGQQHPRVARVDAERDTTELQLTERVVRGGVPCLAVCRGLQALNVVLGGTLIEHMDPPSDGGPAHISPEGKTTPHVLELDAGSLVARLAGATQMAPLSMHHQAIRDLGRGLTVTGRAPDGVIEAVELADHPWMAAVQWHPELTAADDATQQRLFDGLVEAASSRRAGG